MDQQSISDILYVLVHQISIKAKERRAERGWYYLVSDGMSDSRVHAPEKNDFSSETASSTIA